LTLPKYAQLLDKHHQEQRTNHEDVSIVVQGLTDIAMSQTAQRVQGAASGAWLTGNARPQTQAGQAIQLAGRH